MKKMFRKYLLFAACLGIMILLAPTYSAALEAMRCGDVEWSLYGFIRNNTGVWTAKNPKFNVSGNQLATERTWLRVYSEEKFGDTFRVWTALQFIHEPWYPYEEGASSSRTVYSSPVLHEGHEYSEWNNINDVLREMYVEWRPSTTLSFKIGRQIAIWGEAMTTRVNDVIQPDDTRFNFAFANLEDARIPQWMVRTIMTFPSINSSLELVVSPLLTESLYAVNRGGSATNVGTPQERYAFRVNDEFIPPEANGVRWTPVPLSVWNANPLLYPTTLGYPGALNNPGIPGTPFFQRPNVVLNNPITRDWYYNPNLPFGNHWTPLYNPVVAHEYPHGGGDTRGGFRTQTMMSGSTFGMVYYHTQSYTPFLVREDVIQRPTPLTINVGPPGHQTALVVGFTSPGKRQFTLKHPQMDIFGLYYNRVMTPGVFRAEAIYVPNSPQESFKVQDQDGITRRDYVKYMIGYDLNGFFNFSWHKEASFDMTFEHVGEYIPNNKDLQMISGFNETKLLQWNPSFAYRISTNWLYNLIQTSCTISYVPWGNSGFIMPAVGFTPSWFNSKLTFQLQYINLFGDDQTKGLGIFRDKNMIVLTSQFDW